jgi:hypothetical protein
MQLKTYRYLVEVGYYEGSTWYSSTSDQFRTEIAAGNPEQGRRMLEAQYGGKDRVRVVNLGPG